MKVSLFSSRAYNRIRSQSCLRSSGFTPVTSGFTLIELLVVIAVIGVLAGAIIAVINPAEQLARSRDAQRKSAVLQLGKAVTAYVINNNGTFPTQNTTWMTTLVTRGEIKKEFPAVASGRACTNGGCQNTTWGYTYAAPNAYVYVYMESSGEAGKCSGGVGGASSTVYYVYDTSIGKACIKCGGGANFTSATACNATQ